MKIISFLLLSIWALHAGVLDYLDSDRTNRHVEKQQSVKELFRQHERNANGAIKRGEYEGMAAFSAGIGTLQKKLRQINDPAVPVEALSKDIELYSQLVTAVTKELKQNAPKLNEHYNGIVGGVDTFNKKLASIGLRELLRSWRDLTRIKHRFVKKPSAKLAKAFDKAWDNVSITITELYLDEEMEEPLLDFLQRYKLQFAELNDAYEKVGYANVAKIKPLAYKIKMQLELLPLRS
jgi:hypothetical protein